MENLIIIGFALMIASQCAIFFQLRRMGTRIRESASSVRGILPLSTSAKLMTGESAEITARPQQFALRPDRVFIAGSGTENGAADWIVNDIKVLGRSQFCQSGDIPGDMFSTKAIDSFVRLDMIERGLEFKIVVTYIGSNKEGCVFYGALTGAELDDKQVPKQRKRDVRRWKREGGRIQGVVN